jgi:hypothetical protein
VHGATGASARYDRLVTDLPHALTFQLGSMKPMSLAQAAGVGYIVVRSHPRSVIVTPDNRQCCTRSSSSLIARVCVCMPFQGCELQS